MQPWFVAAIGAAAFIAVHYSFLRAAAGRLPDTLGALVLEGTAALGIALYYAIGPRGAAVGTTRLGLGLSVVSGLAISGASILLFYALRRGGSVATTGAIVLGGGVTMSALIAPFAFGESFTVRRIVGVLLGVAAIFVLSGEGAGAP
jgi:drug/metabolite transporter (DMT)-like permease